MSYLLSTKSSRVKRVKATQGSVQRPKTRQNVPNSAPPTDPSTRILKYIRWVNTLRIGIPAQYLATMQHFIPEGISEDSPPYFYVHLDSENPTHAINLFLRILSDGILLCSLISHLASTSIMHLNYRPMTQHQASLNIDKSLQLLWKKGVVASNMPDAMQVYQQNQERVASLFHEIFEVFIMRPLVRRRMAHVQKWFGSINELYGRKIFSNANFWDDFKDAVGFIVVFHALTPPEDRQGRFQIFWHPEDEDELALNIEYCLSLMESFDIPVIWSVSDFMNSANDLEFLSYQMYLMWERLRDAEIYPISPQDEMYDEVMRMQREQAESEAQKIVPQESQKLKKIVERQHSVSGNSAANGSSNTLSSARASTPRGRAANGSSNTLNSARAATPNRSSSPVPVTLYDIQSRPRNSSRDFSYGDADQLDDDARPSRRKPPGPQSHPQKLLQSYKRRNERINTSKKMTPREQRKAYDEKQKRVASRPRSRRERPAGDSTNTETHTAYTELLSRRFSSGKPRSPSRNNSFDEEFTRRRTPEPSPAPASPRQPTFSLGSYSSQPTAQSPRRTASPHRPSSPHQTSPTLRSSRAAPRGTVQSFGVILSQDASETKPRTFQIQSTREVPSNSNSAAQLTARSVSRQSVQVVPSPRSAGGAANNSFSPRTKIMSGRDMDSMMDHLKEVKKKERDAVRTKQSIMSERAEPTRSVMSTMSGGMSTNTRMSNVRSGGNASSASEHLPRPPSQSQPPHTSTSRAHNPTRRFGSVTNFADTTDTPTSVQSIHALEFEFENGAVNPSARGNEVVIRVGERHEASNGTRTHRMELQRQNSYPSDVDIDSYDQDVQITDEVLSASSLSPREAPQHAFSSSADDLTDFNPLSKYEIPSLNLSQLAMTPQDAPNNADIHAYLDIDAMTQDELEYERTLDVLRRQLLNSNGVMAPPGELPKRRAPQPGY